MTDHQIGTREEWQAARAELLGREKELTRMGDELARQRRELPWVPAGKQYTLQAADGPKTLVELFDGRSQLAIYHFMFGPSYQAGCPTCSSIADGVDALLPHLGARDVTMICVSAAPIDKLLAYRERMGWRFTWASSHDSDFNAIWRLSDRHMGFVCYARTGCSAVVSGRLGRDIRPGREDAPVRAAHRDGSRACLVLSAGRC